MYPKLFGPTLYDWGTLIWQNTRTAQVGSIPYWPVVPNFTSDRPPADDSGAVAWGQELGELLNT